MKRRNLFVLALTFALIGMASLIQSCKHDPPLIVIDDNNGGGNGGGGGGDNGGGGTGGIDTTGIPCDPDTIYFEQQILPILASNCAMSGCHDAVSAQDGVILISYTSVMSTGGVTPFNLSNSDLYEVITESDPNDIMPPAPSSPLSPAQISLIANWINQGALNLNCNPNYGQCDTLGISFASVVKPIMDNSCKGCHKPTSLGGGIDLSTHAGVFSAAQSGKLLGSIIHDPAYSAMPKPPSGQTPVPLPLCQVAQIRNWINEGALNN